MHLLQLLQGLRSGDRKVERKYDNDCGDDSGGGGCPYGQQCSSAGTTVAAVVAGVGAGYIAYRCLRMLPSLAPPLWWTIPANAVTP